jgi:biotin synthase
MHSPVHAAQAPRRIWSVAEVDALLAQPFSDLMYQAQQVHRAHFDPNRVQVSTLLSIKTGACPEDCGYCAQSAHHETGLTRERLLPLSDVVAAATAAREQGATRFCMGAAWRNPTDRSLDQVVAMVEAVHDLGLETCVTLGMLAGSQAERLKVAGLDYYNHNLDTSPEFYGRVIGTRTYQDRLDTLAEVQRVGLKVCSGGILGMGESRRDRAGLLCQLANLAEPPESVPINLLVQVEGTPLFGTAPLDPFELVRALAAARILMPGSHVRLSAGRSAMSDELQALCYLAGANSIFYGDRLLTTPNAGTDRDLALFERLGLSPELGHSPRDAPGPCHGHGLGERTASI